MIQSEKMLSANNDAVQMCNLAGRSLPRNNLSNQTVELYHTAGYNTQPNKQRDTNKEEHNENKPLEYAYRYLEPPNKPSDNERESKRIFDFLDDYIEQFREEQILEINRYREDKEKEVAASFNALTKCDDVEQKLVATKKHIRALLAYEDALKREVPPLPEPSSNNPKYSYDLDMHPYDFLSKHWGKYLKHFTPSLSKDYLYLDQLGKLDPELKKALYARRRSIRSQYGYEISEIVPKLRDRHDDELAELQQEDILATNRLYHLKHTRKHSQK